MVLTFKASWNADSYKIFYFLSDDTIAVRKIHENDTGRALLLKRMKIPKDWEHFPSSYPGIYMEYGDEEVIEYYTPKDFKVVQIPVN